MYKVLFRQIYCDTFRTWLRAMFWCHVVIRIFPEAIDLASDVLVEHYLEEPGAMGEQFRYRLLRIAQRRAALVVAMLVIFIAGCPSSPPISPPPDASDASTRVVVAGSDSGSVLLSPCNLACTNMAKLGCAEGTDPHCVDVCDHAQSSGLTNLKPDCLAQAVDLAALKACGTVTCKRDAGK